MRVAGMSNRKEEYCFMSTKISALLIALALSGGAAFGQKVDREGKDWLGSLCPQPAEVKVDGIYQGGSWGKVTLHLESDGKSLSGKGDGWNITGSVSGKRACLVFGTRNKVIYTAVLEASSENDLTGTYIRVYSKKGLVTPDTKQWRKVSKAMALKK